MITAQEAASHVSCKNCGAVMIFGCHHALKWSADEHFHPSQAEIKWRQAQMSFTSWSEVATSTSICFTPRLCVQEGTQTNILCSEWDQRLYFLSAESNDDLRLIHAIHHVNASSHCHYSVTRAVYTRFTVTSTVSRHATIPSVVSCIHNGRFFHGKGGRPEAE